jgi:hypothetical protein
LVVYEWAWLEAGLKWAPEMSAGWPDAMESKSGWAPFEVLKVEKAAEKGLKVRKRGGGGEGSTEVQREELLA